MKKTMAIVLGFALLSCAGVSTAEQARRDRIHIDINRAPNYLRATYWLNGNVMATYEHRTNVDYFVFYGIESDSNGMHIATIAGTNEVLYTFFSSSSLIIYCEDPGNERYCWVASDTVSFLRDLLYQERRIR